MSTEEKQTESERLVKIESHLAHLQRFTDQLNAVVTDQSSQLDVLRRTVSRLENQVKELREKPQAADGAEHFEEKPPHY